MIAYEFSMIACEFSMFLFLLNYFCTFATIFLHLNLNTTMKKPFLFLLFLALIAITPAKAFLVTIPDANFRARLQTLYPACFVGTQMETTCTSVTTAISLNVDNLNIANLSGVQYFTSLQNLQCN